MPRSRPVRGFTLLELLVVVAILGLLASLVVVVASRSLHAAKRAKCLNNLRQFVFADLASTRDNGKLPDPHPYIPSSIPLFRLEDVASRMNMPLPKGPLSTWPKRAKQPEWINCPMARTSGFAEGMVLGGGLYTGYAYVGGLEASPMIRQKLATLPDPEHLADRNNSRRGVLWADVLTEFRIADPRRFENFHVAGRRKYKDFRFHAEEIDGMHRGWSDGSVEWVPILNGVFDSEKGPAVKVRHALGNFYL